MLYKCNTLLYNYRGIFLIFFDFPEKAGNAHLYLLADLKFSYVQITQTTGLIRTISYKTKITRPERDQTEVQIP